MRELYYAIYKNADYKVIIYTSIAEAIFYRDAKFLNEKFILKNETGLFPREKQILSKIYTHRISHFHFTDLFAWFESLLNDCLTQKYLIRILGFHLRTPKFRKDIRKSMNSIFNRDIINFIEDGDLKHLDKISKEISQVNLPTYHEKETYIDSQERVDEAIQILFLLKYYDLWGKKPKSP